MEYVAVVIVTYNSRHVIDDLLDSLPAALAGTPARVVVVDNGSTDGTVDHLRRRGGCDVVASTNDGYSSGINKGVAHVGAAGPILVLNPDVRLSPGAVPALLRGLEVPGTGIVAPRVENEDGSLAKSLRREPTLLRALGLGRTGAPRLSEHVSDPREYEYAHDVDWALGAVLLISQETHERLGGWDESFFLYSEETDLCLRARDIGLATRFEPSAVAMHIGAASGTSNRIHAMQIVNRVRLHARRHGRLAGLAYLAFSVLSEASWLVRGHRQSATALGALLIPSRRPPELNASSSLVPL